MSPAPVHLSVEKGLRLQGATEPGAWPRATSSCSTIAVYCTAEARSVGLPGNRWLQGCYADRDSLVATLGRLSAATAGRAEIRGPS